MASTGPAAAAPGPHPMHEPGPVIGSGQAFLHTMELCLGPAVFMLVMSFAVFCRKPSQVGDELCWWRKRYWDTTGLIDPPNPT